MRVTVQVEGHLREFFPHLAAPTAVVLAGPSASVADALVAVKIAPELPSAVLVGRVRVEQGHLLGDGDELIVLSPMAGG